jgi:hypothetical protein
VPLEQVMADMITSVCSLAAAAFYVLTWFIACGFNAVMECFVHCKEQRAVVRDEAHEEINLLAVKQASL